MLAKKTQILTIAAALLIPVGVQANDTPPEFEFQQTFLNNPIDNPITIDGDLSEWPNSNVIAEPTFYIPKGDGDLGTLVTHEEHNGGTWTGTADQSVFIEVIWDPLNLYISAIVVDDFHENGANSPWNGDSLQMMVADATRESQIGLYNVALNGVEDDANFFPICGPDIPGVEPCNYMNEAGPGEDVLTAVIRGDGVTNYEIQLPAAAFGTESATRTV